MIWAWKNLPDFEMSQANPLKAPVTRETDRISPTIAHIAQVLKHNRRTGVLGAFFSNSAFGIIGTPTLGCVTKTVSATVFLEWSVNSSLWIQGLKREDHVSFFSSCMILMDLFTVLSQWLQTKFCKRQIHHKVHNPVSLERTLKQLYVHKFRDQVQAKVLSKWGYLFFPKFLKKPFCFSINNSESEVAQSCLTLCNPMDCIAYQAPPSMGFSRQENWSGQLKSGNIRYMHETSVEENDPFWTQSSSELRFSLKSSKLY